MKQFILHTFIAIATIAAIAVLATFSGCSATPAEYNSPATLHGPDGTMEFTSSYFPQPEDLPGCFLVLSNTGGKYVYDSLWLSLIINDNTAIGSELNLQRMRFSAAFSSSMDETTETFTGKMILKEKTADKVVIQMKDVRFSIAHGNYTLNGLLTACKQE